MVVSKYYPPWNLNKVPEILIKRIKEINSTALSVDNDKKEVYRHLADSYEIIQYVYYVWLINKVLKNQKGKVVDWGGFVGQITILLRSLSYDCENNSLYYPSQKKLFNKFNIPFKINTKNPKILPYKNNSCLAVISSGVLEHVYDETNMKEKEAFKEIYRILKPGGYFFCWNLPQKYSIIELISTLKKISCHPIKYSIKDIKTLAKNSGFEIIYTDQHGDVCINFLRTILRKLFHPWHAFVIDYYLSKIPIINFFSHHITFVLRKPSR